MATNNDKQLRVISDAITLVRAFARNEYLAGSTLSDAVAEQLAAIGTEADFAAADQAGDAAYGVYGGTKLGNLGLLQARVTRALDIADGLAKE